MQITVTFHSVEEITEFTKKVHMACGKESEAPGPVAPPAPAASASQAAPALPPTVQAPPRPAPVEPAVPVQAPAFTPGAQTVPTATQDYTLDELAKAAMTLMDAGRQAELQSLLAGFGVEALPVLPKEQYGAFATALRGMGAQI